MTGNIDIRPLRNFVNREQRTIAETREQITQKLATNWNLLNPFDAANFLQVMGVQQALAGLVSLIELIDAGNASETEVVTEWRYMVNRKLRQTNFVPQSTNQAGNLVKAYEGEFWQRAADAIDQVA